MRTSGLLLGCLTWFALAGCVLDEPPPGPTKRTPSPQVPSGAGGGGATNILPGPGGGPPPMCGPGGASVQLTDTSPVVEPAQPPPPISGGTLAVTADGTIVAADSDRDLVYLVGRDNVPRTVALLANDEPGRVVAGSAGRAFVALRRAGKIAELDLAAGTVLARHASCPSPRGLAWDEAKQQLSVACATGDLAQLTFEGGALTASVTSHPADDLRDVAVINGGLLLSTFRDARLLHRSDDGAVTGKPSPQPQSQLTNTPESKVFVPRVAWRTVATPSGSVTIHQRALSTAIASAVGQGCLPAPSYGTGGAQNGFTPTQVLGTVHSVVTRVTGANVESLPVLGDAVLPVDVAVAPDESTLVVASPNSGIHLYQGGAFQLLLSATQNAQFTAVAYRDGAVVAFSREPAMLYILQPKVGAAIETVTLSTRSVRSTGHDLFHRATANAIACASCHPEAGEDGHVWVLPEGKRRTPSLRGGLAGTEPFHWSGDQSTMPSLLSDVMVKRMGGAAQSPERARAALAWLDAQPKLAAPLLDAAAVERGRAVFANPTVGCAGCHSGALGTNNANATVGTGLSLQVPRLVELSYRAPYFHDGRVPTLMARFTAAGGGDAHGYVSKLTEQQLADLVTYLKSR